MPRSDIENQVFDELMYDQEKPNQRPLGYGFGVNRSDVFGVHAQLRKRRLNYANNGKDIKRPRKNSNAHMLKMLTSQMSDVLNVVRTGNASNELLNATE